MKNNYLNFSFKYETYVYEKIISDIYNEIFDKNKVKIVFKKSRKMKNAIVYGMNLKEK